MPSLPEPSQAAVLAGVAALRRIMRDDTFIMDHSGTTLQKIVREVYKAMVEEDQ